MATSKLTVGRYQLYLENGKARYTPQSASPTAVEAEVIQFQTFLESWLQAFNLPKPPIRDPQEEEFERMLKNVVTSLRKGAAGPITATVVTAIGEKPPDRFRISEERAREIAAGVVSNL